MLKEMKYGALFGKIRAMSGKLLNKNDYSALMRTNSVEQVISYLKTNTQYSKILSGVEEHNNYRYHVENLLKKDLIKDFSKIIRFTTGSVKEFIKLYYMKYEIESLKLIFRSYEAGKASYEDIEGALIFMAKHNEVNIAKLALSRNLEEFLSRLKGTQYYKLLLPFVFDNSEIRIFNMEMVLDLFFLADIRTNYIKLLDKADQKIIKDFLGMEADIFNIFWIYRGKKFYNMSPEVIKSFSAHLMHKLKAKTIEDLMSAEDDNEFISIVMKTPYCFLYDQKDKNLSEYNYWEFIYKHHKRRARQDPFSIECVISYLRVKEIEINNIISIINGIHYNLSPNMLNRFVVGVKV